MKWYMDLMVDFAFKRLFGQPQGADLLIDFLNAVLQRKDGQRIVELEFHNTEFPAQDRTDKAIRLDVLVRSDSLGCFKKISPIHFASWNNRCVALVLLDYWSVS